MLWAALALCAAACARDLSPAPPRGPPGHPPDHNLPQLPLEANPEHLPTTAPPPPPPDPGREAAEAGAGCAGGGAAPPAHLRLDARALRSLPPLCAPHATHLSAEDNWLEELPATAFRGAPALRVLRLARNHFAHVPAAALAATPHLQALDLSGNQVSSLPDAALPPLPALHTLVLRRNRLAAVSARAFVNTPNLRTLRLEENLLTEIPSAIQLLPLLEDLSVAHNCVEEVSGAALAAARLARLDAAHNPLSRLRAAALAHLPHLTTLIVSEARGLRVLPAAGAPRLRVLRAAHARLEAVSPALCARAPQLRALDLKYNLLETVPDLHECSELRVLELSHNRIAHVGALAGLARLQDLLLAGNLLRRLPAAALAPAARLQLLDLEDNQLEHIDAEAFTPLNHLEELNVGNNRLRALPAAGLARVRRLRAHNNAPLRHFPPPHMLPSVETLVLSYAYHCCEFLALMEEGAAEDRDEEEEGGGLSDLVLLPPPHADLAAWANATSLPHHYLNASTARLLSALSAPRLPRPPRAPRRVRCVPQPGPFLPCVDLFDWWTLRCGVWAVFLLALLGNGTVVFVLVSSRARMDVPRFLVANLAAADLLMGVYLGFLAVVDAGTLGEFRAHAVAWQLSAACRVAGFLGVLSSEVSVFTLAVITLERNYAITHAMHLNKRLSLRHAGAVMAAGWGAATGAAALPLLGVSDYRKFAVCLPFETETPAALAYVVTLLTVNGLAFLVLLGCYLKMYCAIRGSQAWNSNDSRIAKRMALLVFTDFLCWSPIAFFALTAAFGIELVSLEQAKVFTVFVLPLNSCCNPFLYAILTKQFKKDCALVCKAIEESRVTRGIGRCRHSSNFSNRQTPANTNSLAERSSRGGHGAGCACRRLLEPAPAPRRLRAWLRALARPAPAPAPAPRPPAPAPARAGSVSSSVEFSSSRSDSWRTYGRAPPPPRRAASWLVARKTSQDSNLSSSRNDSSGSNATASTGTWRTSRSAGSRPRLTRQPAVLADEPPSPPGAPAPPAPAAPPALHPPARHLHTIPSAAEPDAPLDDE